MAELKDLIGSILSDLVTARHQADILTTDLAKIYKENELLRSLTIPSLNIASVKVSLKIAFDSGSETRIAAASLDPDLLKPMVNSFADAILELPLVRKSVKTDRLKAGLRSKLEELLNKLGQSWIVEYSPDQVKAGVSELAEALRLHGIEIDENISELLRKQTNILFQGITNIKAKQTKSPNLIIDHAVLSKMAANTISEISFEINLDEKVWLDLDGDQKSQNGFILKDR